MDISLINRCIATLIQSSNKLVIPELGALLRKHLPNGTERITFSTLLRYNDGVLQKAVEEARDLTEQEALLAIRLYVEHVSAEIRTEKGFDIPQVGILKMDELNDIVLTEEASVPVRPRRKPRRIADIDIAADTEMAVAVETEEEKELARAKANRLDELQSRLAKFNAAKEVSIKHLKEEPEAEIVSEPALAAEPQEIVVILERMKPVVEAEPETQPETIELLAEEKGPAVEVILYTPATRPEVEVDMTVTESAEEAVVEESDEEAVATVEEPAELIEEKPEDNEIVMKESEDDEEDEEDEDEDEDEESRGILTRSFILWFSIALAVCACLVLGFVFSDKIESAWKGSALDRMFWKVADPIEAKIDKVVQVKPDQPQAAKEEAVPVLSSKEDPNADLIFEEGVYYVVVGSYSSRENAVKGIGEFKQETKPRVMPFAKGKINYVLIGGTYPTLEEARGHLEEWEGSWILYK